MVLFSNLLEGLVQKLQKMWLVFSVDVLSLFSMQKECRVQHPYAVFVFLSMVLCKTLEQFEFLFATAATIGRVLNA